MKKTFLLFVLISFFQVLMAQNAYNLVWKLSQKPFQEPQVGSEMAIVKAGFDTDNDGKGEFLCAYTDLDENYLLMYEANGDNTYDLVWYWKYPVKANTFAGIAVGDLDGNNIPEIVITLPSQTDIIPNPPRLWAFQWNGVQGENKYGNYSGDVNTATAEWNFDLPNSVDFRPYSLVIEDIDNDGRNELIVGIRQGVNGQQVLVVSVDGEFAGFATWAVEYSLSGLSGGSLYSVTTGDLDGDGKKEIYALIWNYLTLHIIECTGPDTYQLVNSLETIYQSSGVDYGAIDAVRVADVNGDGVNELYIAGTEQDNTIFVISNITDVSQITPADVKILGQIPVNAGGKFRTLWIYDTDKDGKLSLMIGGETNGQIFDVEYKGSGDPAVWDSWDVNIAFDVFEHSGISPTATPTIEPRFFYGCPAADMDGDGKNEYVFVNYRTSFSVWAEDAYVWMIESETGTGINEKDFSPESFALGQNYPNPFNPNTKIEFSVPKESAIKLSVFNLLGEEVVKLVDEVKPAGNYSVNFNASNLPSGIYLYRLQADNFTQTKKLSLLK